LVKYSISERDGVVTFKFYGVWGKINSFDIQTQQAIIISFDLFRPNISTNKKGTHLSGNNCFLTTLHEHMEITGFLVGGKKTAGNYG
jgi:hypothetical protein